MYKALISNKRGFNNSFLDVILLYHYMFVTVLSSGPPHRQREPELCNKN